ncbi:MAG: single-stranded-DNA-specific exonuclease RecJ, partial [bacterium]|nr:single-stranded-DNA-specific exonuclease RecJ [bacterium]
LLEELKTMEPFGYGNPEPTFLAEKVTIHQSRIVGKNHLKLFLSEGEQSLGGICFRYGEVPPDFRKAKIAFFPEWNEWQGSRSIQLRIKDFLPD